MVFIIWLMKLYVIITTVSFLAGWVLFLMGDIKLGHWIGFTFIWPYIAVVFIIQSINEVLK